MSFELGQVVGDYEFLDVLERTKTGVTYKVRNLPAKRLEALKVLPKAWQDDQERVERFLREAKVHARLEHPNILTFYAALKLGDQMVMTTELVEGLTLDQILAGGPLPVPDAVRHVSQVLAALEYAHGMGVVHREITPKHMIIMPGGIVKLTGFGMAKATNTPQLTQAGAVVGPLEYISPEQVKGAPDIDGRADLYSLGVVFYRAVTGRLPFESESQFDLMLAHVNNAPRPPIELRPDLPADINAVILKAMAKDPADRFQTAREFRLALGAPEPIPPRPRAVAEARPAGRSPAPPVLRAFPQGAPARSFVSRLTPEVLAAGVFALLMMIMALYVVLTR